MFKSNIFGTATQEKATPVLDAKDFTFQHAEDGKHFTELENFAYSINKVAVNLEGLNEPHCKGFHVYRGEIVCSQCDSDQYDCECEDRTFDFEEAESVVSYVREQMRRLMYVIEELDYHDHPATTYMKKLFEPILKYRDAQSPSEGLDCHKGIVSIVEKYNNDMKGLGRHSMPTLKVTR